MHGRWLALALGLALMGAAAPARSAAPDSLRAGHPERAADSVADGPAATAKAVPAAPAVPRDYVAEARADYSGTSRAYNRARVALRLIEPLFGALVLIVLLFTGVSRRFREIAHGLGHTLYVRVLVYFSLFSATVWLLSLPLNWYTQFALEHQYGLSTQTFPGWLGDSFKELVFNTVLLAVLPVLAIAWGAIEKWPRGWWWRLAAATLPVAMAATLLEPVVFEPLFNKFTPLHDAVLREQILALGARAGIPARSVFEVDMSKRTRKVNAYVNGFGASQRIVLWDTTLQTLEPDEILVVMGHEMGHYVLKHVWVFLGVLAVAAFAALFLTARLTEWLVRAFGRTWGADSPGDLAAFPALLLAYALVSALASPASNAISRRVEHDADVFALEITHDNDAAARAFLKLARDNRSDPEPAPWVEFLFFDHPPLGERIRFAQVYRPWETGTPNRFFHGKR